MIGVHQEVCRHLHRTLQLIEQHGMRPAVVINPATPVEMLIEVLPMVHHVLVMSVNPGFGGQKFLPLALDKIAHLAELRTEMGLNFRIEVDGGVAHDTVARVVEAGADMLVAGSAMFSAGQDGAECAGVVAAGARGGCQGRGGCWTAMQERGRKTRMLARPARGNAEQRWSSTE